MSEYASDFVKAYMALLPRSPDPKIVDRPVHQMLATTIGAALQQVLLKFKYDLEHANQQKANPEP
jgi:hypothetical protein